VTSSARQAVSFLTPVGGSSTPSAGALAWFPIVGAGLGLALGAVWVLVDHAFPPTVAAALVLAADLAMTGMLHLDGLVDAADGLLAHTPRDRRLEVMRKPDAGAFGLGVTVTTLLLRWSALASLHPSPLLLAALWCLSRTVMALAASRLRYARAEGGLASAFLGARGAVLTGSLGIAAALVLASAWRPAAGVASVGAALLAAGAVLGLGVRRIGGFTGDVLGAAGMVGETVGLLVAAAHL